MSAMGSDGVEFWALPTRRLLDNPVGDRGKITTWLTKIAETGGFGWTPEGRQEKLG